MVALAAVLVARAALPTHVAVPFAVGESLEYAGTYRLVLPISIAKVATLSVVKIDTADGVAAWKFSFVTSFAALFYHNHSELVSWTGVTDFVSRRFTHLIDETGHSRHNDFRIFPDSGFFRDAADTTRHPTPAGPIDDLAFFYFLRLPTTRLEIGKIDSLNNYFRKDRNPVVISVLRREDCELPGKILTSCLVLNPVVDDPPHGMFMKRNHALIWLTDDARRLPVQIKSGPYTLRLRKITEGRGGSR